MNLCKLGFHKWHIINQASETYIKDKVEDEFENWSEWEERGFGDAEFAWQYKDRVCLVCKKIDNQIEEEMAKYRSKYLEERKIKENKGKKR